jgi:MoaA/NifB/PqqE/SkfB family radical SAM enzyme
MLWAEITSECQLACTSCYAASGPGRGHGTMTAPDWEDVITQAAALGARRIVFIGGEPTLHPGLPRLVRHALAAGLEAEVFTNLVHITPVLWELLALPGVSLATSWYTTSRSQHAAITGRDTWRQTRASIARATQCGIPVRAGIITGIIPGQQAAAAAADLRSLGVTDISYDRERKFGRGTIPDPAQACGHCGHAVAAVLPDGTVTPCPMTRWLHAGSIYRTPLGTILGEPMTAATATLPAAGTTSCNPTCVPDSYCNPLCIPGTCKPRA